MMRSWTTALPWALLLSPKMAAGNAKQEPSPSCGFCCSALGTQFTKVLAPRIREGVPLELMAYWEKESEPACRRTLEITMSLWDDKVRLKRDGEVLSQTSLPEALAPLCRHLECQNFAPPFRFRVLLNPHWEGRVARLKGRMDKGSSRPGLVNIDWGRLLEKLPSEQVVVDVEARP